MSIPWSTRVHATDASHWGRGVVSDDREVADIRVIGGVCDRWRFSRESESLIAGMPDPVQEGEGETDGSFGVTKPRAEDETPVFSGEVPLDFIGTGWQKVDSAPWSRDEPIPVLEGRVLVWLGQHLARSTKNHDRKHLVLTGSMTATLAWAKGRSSAKGMNRICRQLAALEFATGAQLVPRWVPSEVNPADPPSRARSVESFDLAAGVCKILEEDAAQAKSGQLACSWRASAAQSYRLHQGCGDSSREEAKRAEQPQLGAETQRTPGHFEKADAWGGAGAGCQLDKDFLGTSERDSCQRAIVCAGLGQPCVVGEEQSQGHELCHGLGRSSDREAQRDVFRRARLGRRNDSPSRCEIFQTGCQGAEADQGQRCAPLRRVGCTVHSVSRSCGLSPELA